MKKILLPALLVALTWACKKEIPDATSYSEDYEFQVSGSISGVPFDFKAGEEDYYLETSYSFEDSVVEMKGHLAPEGTPYKNAFEIIIRSKESIATLSQFNVNENFEAGSVALRDASGFMINDDRYIISLFCDSLNQYEKLKWIFPDGTYSHSLSVEKAISAQANPVYPVLLETTGIYNCTSRVKHYINIAEDCDATFDILILANFQVQLSLQSRNGIIEDVKWFHNGNAVIPDSLFNIIPLGLTGEPHKITAEVTFESGCKKIITRTVGANFANNCITDFTYTKEKERTFDPRQLATVEVIYYDGAGKAYSTYYPDVIGEFEMLSSVPYKNNEDGMPTRKFTFKTEAVLKSTNGSVLELGPTSGSFAVAHP